MYGSDEATWKEPLAKPCLHSPCYNCYRKPSGAVVQNGIKVSCPHNRYDSQKDLSRQSGRVNFDEQTFEAPGNRINWGIATKRKDENRIFRRYKPLLKKSN